MKKKVNKNENQHEESYKILEAPYEPLINYRGLKFSTKKDLFIYKDQNFVNNNLKWMRVQTFKLYYDKKYYIQCLYIQNINSINKREVIFYSQNFDTNLETILPFLVDLSNHLKINIITYEYNNKEKESMNYLDVNILFNYLNKVLFVQSIILLGLSVGNKINMNIILSKTNLYPKTKIKGIILMSPTWVYNLANLKNMKTSEKIKAELDKFIKNVNLYNIPVFIIHGKKDKNVKYFLSISFSQQIKKKSEWFPKEGTHLDIIKKHRKKLLIKLKEFLKDNNLLKKSENDTKILSKIKNSNFNQNNYNSQKINSSINNNVDMSFDNNKNIEIIKNNENNNNDENDNNPIYTVCKPKIKNENDISVNQTFSEAIINEDSLNNQSFKNQDMTLNPDINNMDVTLNGEIDITICENTIEYENDNANMTDVSFLPGDIIPTIIKKTNNKNISNEKIEDEVSFMSFHK